MYLNVINKQLNKQTTSIQKILNCNPLKLNELQLIYIIVTHRNPHIFVRTDQTHGIYPWNHQNNQQQFNALMAGIDILTTLCVNL